MKGRGIAALALVALAGCGSTTYVTRTQTETQTETQTQTVVHRAPAPPPRIVTRTVTRVTTAPTPTPAAAGRWSGNGEENVGTIHVASPSTLHWSCSGDCSIFSIDNSYNDDNQLTVNSANDEHSGQTSVDPGTYTDVKVISTGTWVFTIQPNG